MNKESLKNFVLENPNLVSMKPAGDGIYVLKYKKKVFYDNLWNEYLEECRGTIIDVDFNVVSRPFTKVYNYGIESQAPTLSPDTVVTAYRKANGFMVAMTWDNNDILVSTTGSTDSEYVGYAKEMMLTHMCWEDWLLAIGSNEGYTFMFECVHPNDPHIIVEKPGMYFIGWRENTWESKVHGFGLKYVWQTFAEETLKCYSVEAYTYTIEELIEESKKVKHEGFVFYTEDSVAAKIKSPYYLTSKWVARNPRTDKLMTKEFRDKIDEEYYPLIDAIRSNIEEYTAMDEQQRLKWVREYFED
jgi:hypothetical protein